MIPIETPEELELLSSLESGDFISLEPKKKSHLVGILSTASKSTIKKLSRKKPVNIRLIESDIDRLKAIALSKGVPYQTFITELIHKYTSGKLIEK